MRFIVGIFILWRIGLFFASWLGEKILSFAPRFPYSDIFLIPSGLPHWLWSFANFDGVHYLTIALMGYAAQFTQVFFPLYPLIIGIINQFIPFINPVLTGFFISNIFFLFSLIIFHKLLRLDYKKIKIKWMLLFLIFFPTAFFFGSIYTESLFFFLIIASFYSARKKKWLLAGILGGLASATRLIGVFMLPALIWEQYKEIKSQNSKVKITNQNSKISKYYFRFLHFAFYILHSPILYLVPLGLIIYMIYLQFAFGDALYFWHAQPVFGAQRSGGGIILLPQVLWRYFKIITSVPIDSESFWIPLLELVSTLGAITALIVGYFKKIRQSYLIFSYLSVLIPTFSGTFSSMPRYILAAFPIFIVLGMIKSRLIKIFLLACFTILLITLIILFTNGHWVS